MNIAGGVQMDGGNSMGQSQWLVFVTVEVEGEM